MMRKKKILAFILFCLPCLFFILAYLMMSMSGEDVTQANMSSEKSFPGLLVWIWNYIPRIGEFITWPVSMVLSYQTTPGLDLLVRVIDMVAVFFVIYCLSFLALRRRPQLSLRDAGVFNIIFLSLIVIPQLVSPFFGNPFLSGFSFIHNYVSMSLIAILFVVPFISPLIGIQSELKLLKNPYVIFILGFLFAISTELLPFSFIGVLVLYCLYLKFIAHEKIKIEKWQIVAIFGIIAGLAFFYLGGGLSARTGFTYAETYDYISPFTFFKAPKYFVITFLTHFSNNIRYLIPLFCFSLLAITTYRVKKGRRVNNLVKLLVLLNVFSVIYIIGASLIMLDNAIAVRFLLPCYLILAFVVGLYVVDYCDTLVSKSTWRFVLGIVLAISSSVVIADMMIGKIQYAKRTGEQLTMIRDKIGENPNELCLTKKWASSEAGPVYSPLLSFTQEPIFEPWNVKKLYGHEITWAEEGEENICE